MAKGKTSLLNILTGKKKTTTTKKSAASILDAEKTASKPTKTSGSTSAPKKSGNSTQKPQGRQQGSTAPKNNGSAVQTSGTGKTGSTAAGIPNIKPNVTKNVYKKGGALTTLGLGAALGGIGTYLMGVKDSIFPPDENEDTYEDQTTQNDGAETQQGGGNNVWDELNNDAAELLEGAADIPVMGDAVTAAEEGGWSFALLAGIVIAAIAAGVFIYKKAS